MRCVHCGAPKGPRKGWCCEKAELVALRSAVDAVVRDLGMEVAEPALNLEGTTLETIALTYQRLVAARHAA